MTTPQMVRDTSGAPVQALAPLTTQALAVGVASASVAVTTPATLVRLAATADMYVAFGVGSATATTSSMFFPAGAEIFNVSGYTHIAAIVASGTATLTVTRLQ